ncbi:MAG: hypothetical protein LBG42_08305 [Treponema sp.]|nr:hypothetical protein [Treponema sp.]
MTVSQKAALSLLIAVFLFAGFAVLAYTGLFDLVETRFYNPSITRSLNREIARDAESIETFLNGLKARFEDTLDETAVRRSFLPNQSAEDIFERTRLYGMLHENLAGLRSVQFVDSGGTRIHFSTLPQDVFRQDLLSIAFRNYNEDGRSLPYDEVAVQNQGDSRIILDQDGDRVIFAFPFYDSLDVYRGTALFTLSVRAVAEYLVSTGRIRIGDDVVILSNPQGVLTGIPGSERAVLSMVSSIWADGILALTPLDSAASGVTLALISARTGLGIFAGRLVGEDLFIFPQNMKVILLVSFFLTIYLAIFLFFNLKQDPLTIVQTRLKDLQISIIEQYYDRKGEVDWNHWTRELEQRREDVRAEVKRGITAGKGRRSEENIDTLIDKSWDELLSVIGRQRSASSGIDEEKLQSILNRIVSSAPALAAAPAPRIEAAPAGAAEAEAVEDIESLEEAEAVEEIETLDEAEPVEEAEAAEEVETLDGAEPVEEAETVEEAESLDEAEPVAEAENIETLDEAEPAVEAKTVEAKTASSVDAEPDGASNEAEALGGLLAAAEKNRRHNIKLTFGDDDIPYIVETSGLELVDEDIDAAMGINLPGGAADEAEEVEELEELEELDEYGDETTGKVPGESPAPPGRQDTLAQIASEIEFSPHPESDDDGVNITDENVDVESPFVTILSNISVENTEDAEDNKVIPAEILDPDAEIADVVSVDAEAADTVSTEIKPPETGPGETDSVDPGKTGNAAAKKTKKTGASNTETEPSLPAKKKSAGTRRNSRRSPRKKT